MHIVSLHMEIKVEISAAYNVDPTHPAFFNSLPLLYTVSGWGKTNTHAMV